ncbi:MAG: hypothetical protein HPY61_06390 [Methanotrichaceae archaeon]|nr:hypothetical protein [Methanotrichaceae archaeon]
MRNCRKNGSRIFLKLVATLIICSVAVVVSGAVMFVPGSQQSIDKPQEAQFCGKIMPSASISQTIPVVNETNSLLFILNWSKKDSGLQLKIQTPQGTDALVESNSIDHQKGDNFEFYLLQDPEIGNWTAVINAANVSSETDDYCLLVDILENKTLSLVTDSKKKMNSTDFSPTTP